MISVIRSGLAGITQEISVISNNIANASSIGFKKSTASFEDVFSEQNEKRSDSLTGFGITLKQPQRIHSQGSLKETGQALDMGIVGNGMFLLDSREDTGVVTYSRAGSFSVNNQGFIVNMDNILSLIHISEPTRPY